MIDISQHKNLYEIRFKYDPELVDLVKQVPGRRWDPSAKMWTIPLNHLGMLYNQLKGTKYEADVQIKSDENLNVISALGTTRDVPDVDLSKVKVYTKPGSSPFAHQLDFIKYGIANYGTGFLNCDDPGLGKTHETMNLALHRRKVNMYKHCLIVCCINTAKYNWRDDILVHTDGKARPYILGTRLKRNGGHNYATGNAQRLDDLVTGHVYGDVTAPKLPYFIITNIESLRMREGKRFPMVEEIIRLINLGEINMVLIDEIHKNASPQSLQGKCLLKIKEKTGSNAEWIPITGTPIMSKPTDLYTPLKLVDGHNFKSYWTWCQHFCVYGGYGNYSVIGYKNIPEMQVLLQGKMIRRLKKDVFDLPPKTYYTEYVDNTPIQQKLYKMVRGDLLDRKQEILRQMNPLVEILKLRQINGSPELVDPSIRVDESYLSKNAKMARLIELVEDILARDEKIVVYSQWVEPLRVIYNYLSKLSAVAVYTGTMNESDRQASKHRFITDPECKIMIGTIGALGTSHTLTVAKNVIFYDQCWLPSDQLQAEDRCYARGDTINNLSVYTLLALNTVDEVVNDILKDKQTIADFIVDNSINLRNNPKMFELLLGAE